MDHLTKCWHHDGTMKRLQQHKTVVVEPRNSTDLAAVAATYKQAIDSGHGATFFAVCRGKVTRGCARVGNTHCACCFSQHWAICIGWCPQVSEGIDFADKYGRAVVITGLPYAPHKVWGARCDAILQPLQWLVPHNHHTISSSAQLQDTRVALKRQFLDEQRRANAKLNVNANPQPRLHVGRSAACVAHRT